MCCQFRYRDESSHFFISIYSSSSRRFSSPISQVYTMVTLYSNVDVMNMTEGHIEESLDTGFDDIINRYSFFWRQWTSCYVLGFVVGLSGSLTIGLSVGVFSGVWNGGGLSTVLERIQWFNGLPSPWVSPFIDTSHRSETHITTVVVRVFVGGRGPSTTTVPYSVESQEVFRTTRVTSDIQFPRVVHNTTTNGRRWRTSHEKEVQWGWDPHNQKIQTRQSRPSVSTTVTETIQTF